MNVREFGVFRKLLVFSLSFFSSVFLSYANIYGCRPPIDNSLLSLYMRSDAVATAYIRSESVTRSPEDGPDYIPTINQKVHIAAILKGSPPLEYSYSKQYQISDKYGLRRFNSRLKPGDKVLLFLAKAKDKQEFYLAELHGPSDKYNEAELAFIETRFGELREIIASKRAQMPMLTEWFVKLAENKATMIEGASALAGSFEAMESEGKKTPRSEVRIGKGFSPSSTSQIARYLSQYQKQRLSKAFYRSMGDALKEIGGFGESQGLFEYEGGADSLAALVSYWDRQGIADHLTMLLKSNLENRMITAYLTSVICDVVFDEQLSAYREEWGRVFPEKDEKAVSEAEIRKFANELKRISEPHEDFSGEFIEADEAAETKNLQAGSLPYGEYRRMLLDGFQKRLEELAARAYEPDDLPWEEEAYE